MFCSLTLMLYLPLPLEKYLCCAMPGEQIAALPLLSPQEVLHCVACCEKDGKALFRVDRQSNKLVIETAN